MIAALILVASAGCARVFVPPPEGWRSRLGRGHPLTGRIWSVAGRRFVGVGELLRRARKARWVLLGEKHDNADHHALQAWVIRALVGGGRLPAVVMEMLRPEQADRLARWRRRHPADAAGLGPAVGWQRSGWPEWSIYAPIARAALAAGLRIVPGDAARRRVRLVSHAGLAGLKPRERRRLGLVRPLPALLRDALLADLARSHCGLMSARAVRRMLEVQRFRDASLADALVRAARGRGGGAVLIAGAGHVRRDWAVPRYLAARGTGDRSLSIAFAEVQPREVLAPRYVAGTPGRPPFDLLWFTPRPRRTDPCVKLKKRLGRSARRSSS